MTQQPQTTLDIPRLSRALDGCAVGCTVEYREVTGSTMDDARALADEGAPDGLVVVAEEQTAGRGRFNRPWVAPKGENLAFSVVLYPTFAQLAYMNMAATLAIADVTEMETGMTPTIKWPNDVKVGGRKIAGILVETAVEQGSVKHAVLGIGFNVNFDPSPYPEIADIATSLRRESRRVHDRTDVLAAFCRKLDEWYGEVKRGTSLRSAWAARLETLGRNVQVRWGDQVHEGLASDVDDQGNLILTRDDGLRMTVIAGEVTLQV